MHVMVIDMIWLCIALLSVVVGGFLHSYNHQISFERTSFNFMKLRHSISSSIGDPSTEPKIHSSFDSDFANDISKPLPQWYKDSLTEKERLMKEIEKNRERIIQEFKAKYEVSEEEKQAEVRRKSEKYKRNVNGKRKIAAKPSFFGKVLGLGSKKSIVEEDLEDISDVDLSTKEKWDAFWKEEEEATGFYLPGFFEVFPELKLKWPTWAKRRDGSRLKCTTDADCPFPLACCPHPIVPGQNFCCSGWGQRVMVKSYVGQEIASADIPENSNNEGNSIPTPKKENWRPET